MNPVTHVIFDVDGLLLNTEGQYTDMMDSICNPHGKSFTLAIKKQMMGRKGHEAARILIDALDLPITVEQYLEQVRHLQKEMFPKSKLLPGVERLVKHLNQHKIPMALATGSGRIEFDWKIENHGDLFDVFTHSVFSSSDPDVKHGKPAPDCFLVCASRFTSSPEPEKVLVFEDAPNGVEGALAAGMQVVWVPDPSMHCNQLKDRATLTLDSLEDFKPEVFGLPPFPS